MKDGENDESEVDEEEAAIIVRKFKRMFNKNSKNQKSFTKKPSTSKADSGCHKCGSLDHFIRECPQWDIEKGKGKAKEPGIDNKKFLKIEYKKGNGSNLGRFRE